MANYFYYMDDDYNYVTSVYRRYYKNLKVYYPTFRAQIEDGET